MSFLGVQESAKGFTWVERAADPALCTKLQQTAGLDPLAAQLLARRGIKADQVDHFLQPRLRDLLPDPSTLKGFADFEQAFFEV